MTIRPLVAVAAAIVAAAAAILQPAGAHAAPPACTGAAERALPTLAAHNKHCADPAPEEAPAPTPEPEVVPAPEPEPEPEPEVVTAPEPEPEVVTAPEPEPCALVTATSTAGDYTVVRRDSQTLAVHAPAGGFAQATKIAVLASGAQYTFERGYDDGRLSVGWSDTEVVVRGWWLFPGRTVTSIMFATDSGVVLDGWHDLDTPLAMVDEYSC